MKNPYEIPGLVKLNEAIFPPLDGIYWDKRLGGVRVILLGEVYRSVAPFQCLYTQPCVSRLSITDLGYFYVIPPCNIGYFVASKSEMLMRFDRFNLHDEDSYCMFKDLL